MKAILSAALLLLAIAPAFGAEPPMTRRRRSRPSMPFMAPLHAQGGGIPDATARVRYAPVLSPRLNKQLVEAAAAQARLTAKVKNAVPPMLEGDIFSSLFEGAGAWKVGACQVDGQHRPLPGGAELCAGIRAGPQSRKARQLERHGAAGEHAAGLESG